MTIKSHEPPFDGKPCAMCQIEVRSISALVHNFLTRWPENKSIVKLHDIVRYHSEPLIPKVANAAVEEMLSATQELIAACHDMKQDGNMITWTPGTVERIGAVVPRLKKALYELQPITDAHFDDARHSHGEENILREQRGSVAIEFLPKYDYHYWVRVVKDESDLVHLKCNTKLQIHDHFRTRMEANHTFYAKVFCPTCRVNSKINEFTCFWEN